MKTSFGLGDLAYYLFRPVVYFIDWCWGTDLRHCEVCSGRRARWNAVASAPAWLALTFFVTLAAAIISWW